MSEARRRRLATLALVVAVLTAGLLGTVDASQQMRGEKLTTGHSVFADASTSFNSCFAGLAGALLQQVTWFNGQTLFSRMEGGGEKYVYVTEHFEDNNGDGKGNPDGYDDETHLEMGSPTEDVLYRTNNTYKFSDKNDDDKDWVVREYFALRDHKNVSTGEDETSRADTKEKVYVFVVEVHDEAIWDPTLKKDYNFAMVVDTCRFHETGNETGHEGHSGNSGMPAAQHENQTGMNESHTHGTFDVDIYIGGEPTSLTVQDQPQIPDVDEEGAGEGGEDGGSS
jgi:hypothetical protein